MRIGASLLIAALGLLTSSVATAQDYNIVSYGAKCDGHTDDSSAIQTALNAANSNHGGRVVIPLSITTSCVFASALDMDGFVNVSLEGLGSSGWNKPTLAYSGTASPAISMKSTLRVTLKNLAIEYTNTGFSGMLLDTEHGISGSDSAFDVFDTLDLSGPAGSPNAICLICGDRSINLLITNSTFNWAENAIRGAADSSGYANSWTIRDNEFSSASGTISGAFLLNPSAAWAVIRNTFELGTAASTSLTVMDNSTISCAGCEFTGNWGGDAPSNWAGTVIKNFGTGGQGGIHVSGNWFEAGNNANATFMSIYAGSTRGISVTGNLIGFFGKGIVFTGSTANDVFVYGNFTGLTVTGAPASGLIEVNPGSAMSSTFYNKVGVGTSSPTHLLEVVSGGTTLADAWTVRSSRSSKTNIQQLRGALAKVEHLQGVSYDSKVDGKHQIGVVAEDVEKIVPEIVSRDPETKRVDGVDYSRLTALLIEAVKSQQAEIKQLQKQINRLSSSSREH
jgi:Chaperone of endosialidase